MTTINASKKVTITHNGFHGFTTANLRVSGEVGETIELTAAQVRKLDHTPCGSSTCRCGESMLCALADYGQKQEPSMLTIPESGEIELPGNYPQR